MKDTPAHNLEAVRLLRQALVSLGVRDIVLSPGSRSTPLVAAAAGQTRCRTHIVLDERSAAFLALGISRSTRRIVPLIATSGSAIANWVPAFVEAHYGGGCILGWSADRPPELHGCRAPQTIDQLPLLREYCRFQANFPCPGDSDYPQFLWEALQSTIGLHDLPVHWNLPFREPFLPPDIELPLPEEIAPDGFMLENPSTPHNPLELIHQLPTAAPVIVLAGWRCQRELSPSQQDALAALCQEKKIPLLADTVSGLRSRHDAIKTYPYLLRTPDAATLPLPQSALVIGGLPTSKALRNWLIRHQIPLRFLPDNLPDTPNPLSCPQEKWDDPLDILPDPFFAEAWHQENQKTTAAIRHAIQRENPQSEARIFDDLDQQLPDNAHLIAANSTTIRNLENFFLNPQKDRSFSASRGANGIDGTLSQAIGIAYGFPDKPCYLITGDLALLHDSNGFAIKPPPNFRILLINNHGGGIFRFLPIAKQKSVFDTFFLTPQNVSWQNLLKAHGWQLRKASKANLRKCHAQPTVIEFPSQPCPEFCP